MNVYRNRPIASTLLAAALAAGSFAWPAGAADEEAARKTAESPAAAATDKATAPAKAVEPQKATGTVAGTVVGTDGKAAPDVKIRLLSPENATPRKSADAAAAKPRKVPAVAETEAGADGAFTLADVPAGEYVVVARLKGAGNARQSVTVAAGETVKVSLTLKAPAAAATK